MAVDILRVESNERVDITDFEFISKSVQAHERQMVDNFFCDPARTRKWVVSGFGMSNPAAKQLQVTKGKAILGARLESNVEYGMLTTEGDATLTVDLNSYSPGTYGIYIRFEQIAGEAQSRIFWNPSGAGSEYAQSINTRLTAAWSLRVEATSPGSDWLKIGEVDQATMAITDQREFYFEGAVVDTYESGWSTDGGGSANDRNSDRATYGVTDLQMMLAALRQGVEDVKGRGLRRWWDPGIGGLNVGFDTDPTEDRVNVGDTGCYLAVAASDAHLGFDSGDQFRYYRSSDVLGLILGTTLSYEWDTTSFRPAAGASVNLGNGGAPWPNLYATILRPGQNDGDGVSGNLLPVVTDGYDLGNLNRQWKDLWLAGDARITGSLILNTAAASGLGSSFFPVVDGLYNLGDSASGLGSGTNRRFNNLFLDNGFQIEKASGDIDLAFYTATAPLDEKWWQLRFENASGSLQFRVLDDSYANPDNILVLGRSAAGPDTITAYGTLTLPQSSGYPTTPYDPALKLNGTNPYLHFDDADTGINAAHRDWGILAYQGSGDIGKMRFIVLNTAGTTEYNWLDLESSSGAVTDVAYATMNASAQWTYGTNGTDQVFCINAQGNTAPSSSNMLGLTNRWYLGAAGAAYSILGVSGATPRNSTGFLRIWVNGVSRYVPFFDNYNG